MSEAVEPRNEAVEPWLRGTLTQFDPVRRQVLHALQLADEDAERWCGALTEGQLEARPAGVASAGFHLRHIARSLDRLLTYAEGGALSREQLRELRSELLPATGALTECHIGLQRAMERVVAIQPECYDDVRGVGRERLPTTVAGLLIHCAEHTQRHIGQAITTARIVSAKTAEAGG